LSVAVIADFISDVAMARRGFPRTGISACYGGPLFSILACWYKWCRFCVVVRLRFAVLISKYCHCLPLLLLSMPVTCSCWLRVQFLLMVTI